MSPEDFAEVEPLVRAGRLKEAAARLKRSAGSGARWEAYLWLGRIEEKRGRPERAERAYRAAAAAAPGAARPCIELARLLEAAARPAEARAALRPAAERAGAELCARAPSESLFGLLEFNLFRRVFVAEVLGAPETAARLEPALRALPQAGARTLLCEVLLAQGKRKEAEAALLPAFGPGARGAETSRVEVLFALVDRGGCGRPLERAVLSCLGRAEDGGKLAAEWPRLFSCLMGAGRYEAAFRLAEAVLDREGNFEDPRHLMWPWFRRTARAVSEESFIRDELARLAAAERGDLPHWFAYYRAILWSALGVHNAEALAELPRIKALDPARYSWMLQSFVLIQLRTLDFSGAASTCRKVLEGAPSHWWARCRLAEARLGQGEPKRALRELERAARGLGPLDRREVLTWHGEVLLWLGDYAGALGKLDEAVALGARSFAHGWRGAARFLSGDARGALEDLDLAVDLDAKDFEARAWRGEVRRGLGRSRAAQADLDLVVDAAPDVFWARVNRALLSDAQDRPEAMAQDFLALPRDLTAFLREALRLPPEGSLDRGQMRRALSYLLERAKGNRRWELYAQQVWRSPS